MNEADFWERVEKTDSCWLWRGSIGKKHGYGYFGHGQAHRYSYELANGPIPDGLTIDHLCRVRTCVRPDHLEAVTMRENVLRGVGPSAINARKETCARGHRRWYMHRGKRHCRDCMNEASRAYKARKRAER